MYMFMYMTYEISVTLGYEKVFNGLCWKKGRKFVQRLELDGVDFDR